MPGRNFNAPSAKDYRYGFNGKENDNEVKGKANQQDYGKRIYDPRMGRFFSEDPITKEYPELTPYQFASNTPIWAIDIDGLEGGIASPMGGQNVVNAQTAKDYNAGKSWFSQPASRWMKLGLAAQMNAIQPTEVYNEYSFPNMTKGQYLAASMAQSQINNSQSSRSFSSRSTRVPQRPHAEAEVTVAKPKLTVPIHENVNLNINKQASATQSADPYSFIRTETPSGNKSARGVGANIKIINAGGTLAPIEVANINNNLYIINGHHRVEAARLTNTKLQYKILTVKEWQAYQYKSESEIIGAAAEASRQRVKLDKKLIQKAAEQTP